MSSSNQGKRHFRFKNQKLYRRINFSFSFLSLAVTAFALIVALIVCVFLLLNISRRQFQDFNGNLVDTVLSHGEEILATPEDERIDYLFEEYVLPVSDLKREVSVRVSDGIRERSNDVYFEQILQNAQSKHPLQVSGSPGEIMVQKFKYEGRMHNYVSIRLDFGGYAVEATTFQDIQDNYIYIIILSIVIGSVLVIVMLSMLLLGQVVTKKALAPLEGIAEAVKSISEENLALKLKNPAGENEVDSLIIALNGMLNRLNFSFEEQRRFVSDVSHELRIPLTILQGYVDIIQNWGKDDEKILDESLDAISDEILSMKELVEKLLFLQNLGSGNYNLEMEETDVNQLLSKAVFDTQILTQEHRVSEQLSGQNPVVLADKSLLSQALRAIIDNSIKYTDPGGEITIVSACDRHKVRIIIQDTGCGIAPDQLEKVKERFYRVDSARAKKTGGSGLGLSIVNAIVEAMGGELILESGAPKGCVVVVTLPRV